VCRCGGRQQAKEAAVARKVVDVAEELHYKNGFRGWAARHLVRLRAVGATLEPTLVVLTLIIAAAVWLTDQGKVGLWVVVLLPSSLAALWTGAALGSGRLPQIMFRGALIGVVQGCVYLAVTNEALDKRHELEAVVSLMFLNFFLFTMLGGISATIADSVIVSEAHWQKTAANREFMWKALYISSLTFKIPDDAAPRLVIAVRTFSSSSSRPSLPRSSG
jgi:hypothetical protein